MIVSPSRDAATSRLSPATGSWSACARGEVDGHQSFPPGPGPARQPEKGGRRRLCFLEPRPAAVHAPFAGDRAAAAIRIISCSRVTGYPRLLEPSVPAVDDARSFFRELAGRIGRAADHLALRSGDLHRRRPALRFSCREFFQTGRAPGPVRFPGDRQFFRSVCQGLAPAAKSGDRCRSGHRHARNSRPDLLERFAAIAAAQGWKFKAAPRPPWQPVCIPANASTKNC